MRGLTGDEGTTAILVALTSAVLFGFGALVVDVGSWYAEGRQLQNGAQAAAVAVVQGCVKHGICDASTAEAATAGVYANSNATDGRTRVTSICGTGPGLIACLPTPRADNYDCQPLSGTAPYAEVRTQTLTGSGSDRMPPLLIRALRPSDTGKTVHACARASYGAPAGMVGKLPLTISMCELLAHTGGTMPPSLLAAEGPYPPWPDASYERVLYFHDTTEAGPSDCPASASGMDDPLSGGFGWLASGSCVAETDTVDEFGAAPGTAPKNCSDAELAAMLGKVVEIPVFIHQEGTGINGVYTMGTYAAFVLTGYYLGGQYREPSLMSGLVPCGQAAGTGSQRCISGFFTTSTSTTTGIVTGPSNGVTVIQITG